MVCELEEFKFRVELIRHASIRTYSALVDAGCILGFSVSGWCCNLSVGLEGPEKTRSHREHCISTNSSWFAGSSRNADSLGQITHIGSVEGHLKGPWCDGTGCDIIKRMVCITRNPQARTTASFRATATMARFLLFFPPRSNIRVPQRLRSLSGPKRPNRYRAHWTGRERSCLLSALLILSCCSTEPDWRRRGVSPRYAGTSLE